jgi:hypothetical protein
VQDEGRGTIEPALPARLEGAGEIKEADYAVWLKEYSGKAQINHSGSSLLSAESANQDFHLLSNPQVRNPLTVEP